MLIRKRSSTSLIVFTSLLLIGSLAQAQVAPKSYQIQGVNRIKQMTNYCGPASLTMVLRYWGQDIDQQTVGKYVFDKSCNATDGADMLLFAREEGYSAYSWNSGINDVKQVLSAGVPVIVLQQNSIYDTSGHYRVLTGYDDKTSEFSVADPYYGNITHLSYSRCQRLWKSMGYWALLVVPRSKDIFKTRMDETPVVHMDLSYAEYKRKEYDQALKQAKLALHLEPGNSYAESMLTRIQAAMGAGGSRG